MQELIEYYNCFKSISCVSYVTLQMSCDRIQSSWWYLHIRQCRSFGTSYLTSRSKNIYNCTVCLRSHVYCNFRLKYSGPLLPYTPLVLISSRIGRLTEIILSGFLIQKATVCKSCSSRVVWKAMRIRPCGNIRNISCRSTLSKVL